MSSQNQRIKQLIDTNKTVFSSADLRGIWNMQQDWFKTIVKRMVDQGLLNRLDTGYYSLRDDFDPYELANTIVTPSYISFTSALYYFDVSFQVQQTISSAANLTYHKEIGDYNFHYHKIKEDLLFNLSGIKTRENITIATPERAILDSYYLNMLPNIDRKNKINKSRLEDLAQFYPKTVQIKAEDLINSL